MNPEWRVGAVMHIVQLYNNHLTHALLSLTKTKLRHVNLMLPASVKTTTKLN